MPFKKVYIVFLKSFMKEHNIPSHEIEQFLNGVVGSANADANVDDVYDKCYYYVSSSEEKRKDILNNLSKDISAIIDVYVEKTYEDLFKELDIKPQTVSGQLFACRNKKCRNTECKVYSLQMRRCDEGPTIFIMCPKCGSYYKKG